MIPSCICRVPVVAKSMCVNRSLALAFRRNRCGERWESWTAQYVVSNVSKEAETSRSEYVAGPKVINFQQQAFYCRKSSTVDGYGTKRWAVQKPLSGSRYCQRVNARVGYAIQLIPKL